MIPLPGGFRVACNRDELRSRPPALPPVTRRFGSHDVTFPVDPISDGTWIAASDAGLAMALLNANPSRCGVSQSPRLSRGLIIPSLLWRDDTRAILRRALRINPSDFLAFRLLIIDSNSWSELYGNGHSLSVSSHPFDGAPIMFTSSGLGDDRVEGPRRLLFDRMIRTADISARSQDDFHHHSWPDRPHLSVRMRRADARTVSYTTIEMIDKTPALNYHAWACGTLVSA